VSVLPRLSFGFRHSTPVILQTEVAECGLACLAMVANHYGHKIDLASIRRRFSASLKGVSLDDFDPHCFWIVVDNTSAAH
jgi:ATP-binding cassette subfamily B protein RaxB